MSLNVEGVPTKASDSPSHLLPKIDADTRLRGASQSNATALHAVKGMPCQCDAHQNTWLPSRRTTPKCIFIDLGAADGNTLRDFVAGKYGPVANCPSGQWEATLVEANPRFDAALKQTEATYPGVVHAKFSHAAYMCEAQTTFYLDTKNHDQNYWGSSMSENHADTKASGHVAVTVPTINIMRLLYETTIPSDFVILKMDIEGSEWDVLPCLANAASAPLVDRLLVEVHPQQWGNAGTTQPQFDAAIAALRAKGVDIPNAYHSQTL
jgi:FkbM family methyltransferase